MDRGLVEPSGALGEVTEEETAKILNGTPDNALLTSLRAKIAGFPALDGKKSFSILVRNQALIRAKPRASGARWTNSGLCG